MALLVTLLFWMPRPEEEYLLFVWAALWGAADAIWQTLINGENVGSESR